MRPKAPRAIQPSYALELYYRRKLVGLIDEMHASVMHWVGAAFKANPPAAMAQDKLPSAELQRVIRTLVARWTKRFSARADTLATMFARAAQARSDSEMRRMFKDAGLVITFQMSREMRDVISATIAENVALIRSIPREHLYDVDGAVMRSFQTGRDIGGLTKTLREQFDVAKRRAATIALHQNNMATAVFTRVRQQEAGIRYARWRHSHAGKQPRPTHLRNDGKVYEIAKGWFDPDADGKGKGRRIFPGELINCRCTSQSLIPGVHRGA